MAKYGNLFPYLIAMLAGVLLGELSKPVLELGTLIRIPDFSNIFHTVSIFAVGFPPISKFISAIPLALICYVLAFGDFVTSQTLVEEAQDSRSDEYIDFNSSRSNLISGLRNLILAIFAPFPPLAGPLWIGMTVSVAMRYKEGKKSNEISDRWNEFFPYGNIHQCYFSADRVIHETNHGCGVLRLLCYSRHMYVQESVWIIVRRVQIKVLPE